MAIWPQVNAGPVSKFCVMWKDIVNMGANPSIGSWLFSFTTHYLQDVVHILMSWTWNFWVKCGVGVHLIIGWPAQGNKTSKVNVVLFIYIIKLSQCHLSRHDETSELVKNNFRGIWSCLHLFSWLLCAVLIMRGHTVQRQWIRCPWTLQMTHCYPTGPI